MSDSDFAFLRDFLLQRSGAVLWTERRFFASLRLGALAQVAQFPSIAALLSAVQQRPDGDLATRVVEVMTTNETFFFRDQRPFDQIETVILPRLLEARRDKRELRIWCAAVSSGQEAYSIAMMLARHASQLAGWKVGIVGTDISRDMIAKAKSGRYSHFEVQRGMPISMLLQHFTRSGDMWEISGAMRRMVEFRVNNLTQDTPGLGKFDLILLRNVLIYFDVAMKTDVLKRVARHLAPDGAVMVGAAESTLGLGEALVPDPENRGLYVGQAQARAFAAAAERAASSRRT
jgi:chemotaxis protein methyltransferase CheR